MPNSTHDHDQRDNNDISYNPTNGLRHVSKIHMDDLSHKVFEHFEADGRKGFYEEHVMSLGDNILQSPIERAVFAFLLVSDFGIGLNSEHVHVRLPGEKMPDDLLTKPSACICPQFEVDCFNLDFGVFINTGQHKLAFDIECDGFEFHGSTNSQLRHDYWRDCVVSKEKFQIYRIPGKEINRHPLWAVEQFALEIQAQVSLLHQAA